MICIIPARGGSKRIPYKNIKPFCGAPILSYPVNAAIQSGLFDEVVVSTEDGLIGDYARSIGANIVGRSEFAASDMAETEDVLFEVLSERDDADACLMYPTSVFAPSEMLWDAWDRCVGDVTFSVTRVRGAYQRYMTRWPNGQMTFLLDEHNGNSQDYTELYSDAAQFYFFDVDKFFDAWSRKVRLLEMPNTGYIIRHAVDINEPTDWELAEWVYKGLHSDT